jgi:outer membrane translocation and assembly module TamA
VEPGEVTRISRVFLESQEDLGDWVRLDRKRDLLGKTLTPAALDEVEKWVTEALQIYGFACPEVKTEANADTGEIKVWVNPCLRLRILEVRGENIPQQESKIFRRYDAFQLGTYFEPRLLRVTEERVIGSRIVESYRLSKECTSEGVILKQEAIPGLPRLLTIGFGANTEGVILGKASWRNTRLGSQDSSLDLTANGSARIQNIQANLLWYTFPSMGRLYLNPFAQLDRRDELKFESLEVRGRFTVGSTWDLGGYGTGGDSVGGQFFLGPSINFYRTYRGEGAPSSQFLNLEGLLILRSHLFEYYLRRPQNGFISTFAFHLADSALFSSATAQRLEWTGQSLWNIFNLDPPFWIVGIRWGFASVLTSEPVGFGTKLPAPFFRYLGGSADLRGFGRLELPADGQGGGLTSGFAGVEFRLSHTLPFDLDPFVFVDVGAIGRKSFSFDPPVYWSPGIGMRWASPAGAIRTTLAHGISGSATDHWQFYFSFGEEF